MYTLIDPPISPFSPPEKITAWIDELRSWISLPEFRDHPENRKRLDEAIAEAEQYLKDSREHAGTSRQPPNRPAV
ncbi:MAG TPA: hypothetical protein VF092_29120 [Longimicrobium sp.]